MQSRVPDPPGKSGSSKARAFALVLLVLLCSAGFLLVHMTDFLGQSTPDNSVAVAAEPDGAALVRVTLVSRPNDTALESVHVETALGTRLALNETGDHQRVLALHNETIEVYTVRNGTRRVVRTIPVEAGVAADAIVAADGSGDYRTIQAAVNASTPGATIVVKRDTYHETVTVGAGVTILGEPGTRVLGPNGTRPFRLSDGATVRFINATPEDESAER